MRFRCTFASVEGSYGAKQKSLSAHVVLMAGRDPAVSRPSMGRDRGFMPGDDGKEMGLAMGPGDAAREECQTARKPGSVPPLPAAMAIPLGRSSPNASRDRPERRRGGPPGIAAPAMPAAPTWSCSRWGLPCRRHCWRCGALLPHRFTLAAHPHPSPPRAREGRGEGTRPQPVDLAVCFLWHFP